MANIVVGLPQVNAANQYVNGLNLTWQSNTTIAVNIGAARDSTGVQDIVLPAITTLNAATVGVNGLDTGTLGVSTFYYVYVIGSSLGANPDVNISVQASPMAANSTVLNGIVITEGVVTPPTWSVGNNYQPGVLLSLSNSAPNLPAGYDMFRRIGAVLTNGSSQILDFWQAAGNNTGRMMYYDAAINVLTAGASASFVAINLSTAVPLIAAAGYEDLVMFDVLLTPTGAGNHVNFRPTGSSSTNGMAIMSGDVAGVVHEDSIQVIAAPSAGVLSVDYKVTGTVTVNVTGYVDYL
jgi:hypothetical protein